jgi:hypothetical protein
MYTNLALLTSTQRRVHEKDLRMSNLNVTLHLSDRLQSINLSQMIGSNEIMSPVEENSM